MAKKSPAELKAEGAELGTLIAAVRKRPHNFALLIGKEGLVLEAHPKKGADLMRRAAKAKGAGPKGAAGTMTLSGKVISLHCEDENFPGSLPKLAKKHFSERGLAYKVVVVLPDGGELSDGEEDEAEDNAEVSTPDGDAADVADPPADRAEVAEAPPASGGADVSEPTTPEDGNAPDPKAQILEKLAKNRELIETALASSNRKAAQKVEVLSNTLGVALDQGTLDRAASTLTLLLKTAKDVAKRFPPDQSQVSGPVELPESITSMLSGAWNAASEWAGDALERMAKAQRFDGKGLPDELVAALVEADEAAPGTVETALADIATMEAAKIQPSDVAALLKLKQKNPKSYAAAMTALETMDPGGAVDLSPAAVATSMKTLQDLRNKQSAAYDDWRDKDKALDAAAKTTNAAEQDHKAKKKVFDAAKKAHDDFKAAKPPPLSPADATKLANLRATAVAAQTDLNNAHTAWTAAYAAYQTADTDWKNAQTLANSFDAPIEAAETAQKKIDDKRDLLQALNFGPLSEGAEPPLDDAAKEKMIAAYGACPDLGKAALDLVSDSEDPALIVENVGFIADKFTDGFADKDGNKIAAGDEDRAIMAANALRMGATEGQAYFDGFKTYLESGKQRKADPNGGDKPAPKGMSEREHTAAVNTQRAATMADKLMDKDGKVDFSTKDAKDGMDHMMFHPGSLRRPGPALIKQVRGLEANFADQNVGPGMQATLDATALPDGSTPEGAKKLQTASKIVGGTVGKTPPAPVSDLDAKHAVMAAMISPLSQGPVGSCFATAPVRKVREQDPARAMAAFSQIASTGTYTDSSNRTRPADANPTVGENTLMRSWEYSVATAAADNENSVKRGRMNNALFGSGSAKNLSALGAADIFGDKWNDHDVDGVPVDGMKKKLREAIDKAIVINYSAGPSRASSGGGDGRSESGVHDLMYDGKVLSTEQAFLDAILEIAYDTSGEDETTAVGQKIKAVVQDPAFVQAILASRGAGRTYKPWEMPGGGFGDETTKVLQGGTPGYTKLTDEETTGQDPGVRTRALLEQLAGITAVDSLGNADDRPLMTTNSKARGANHMFALLPDHPSFLALKAGDMATNIENMLLKPGAEMADTELPLAECVALFEEEVQRLAAAWQLEPAAIDTALAQRPTSAMKPAAIKAHVSTVMEDARKAQESEDLAEWEGKQNPAPTAAKKEEKRKLIEEDTRQAMTNGIDTALVDRFDPPEVVLADTNWGGPTGQVLFVLAPDPSTGALRLWEKNDGTGKLTPCKDVWADAKWKAMNE
ncbi:MAG: hypothetical protein AAGG09_05450 [Pseudomonadota bacterium]